MFYTDFIYFLFQQAESTDFTRMMRFLDMVAENNKEGFAKLMDLFAAKQLPWLRDEMYADYLAEKGDLKVEVSSGGSRISR